MDELFNAFYRQVQTACYVFAAFAVFIFIAFFACVFLSK